MPNMTSLERVRAAANRMEPDVVPVGPYMGNHGAKVGGALISQYCTNGRIMAKAQLKAWEIYQQDIIVAQSDNYYIAEGFGITVDMHEDSTPTLREPVVHELQDVYKLRVPDPYKDGRMPVYLEAIDLIKEQVGGKVAIRGTGTGPFSLASHLMGTQRFLMELAMAATEPEGKNARALRHLLELTSDALIAFAKAQVEAGADIVQAGDSLASIDVISPKMYKEWAFPYEKKFFNALNICHKDRQVITLLHVCGDMTPVLPLMADTGAMILELDYKVDLGRAKAVVGDRVCLMGNLDPSELLLRGTPDEVAKEAQRCIDLAGKGGGFILGSGCELAYYTPQVNVRTMIRVARENRYPL
ncbi:methylcobamide--CoM methyltransferase [Moorella sp. E308F]|uniref:uroporphyrinogen decarboxylase family protein n=1 Tax=Moorella sp. E308F TaxID=2572682 RepID=UPI0010FFB4AA|nr:uroporphyrinogen decarboxylase family protein [Moorella sp. E308F]GEA15699.1 methylcobamide--CoM methyltransferase [Moorella sp. E308F]